MEVLWLADPRSNCIKAYESILSDRFALRHFSSLGEVESQLILVRAENVQAPELIISEIEFNDGGLAELLQNYADVFAQKLRFMVVSDIYDLQTMRFYFDQGAQDYILKPVNENELIVKVEQALAATANLNAKTRELNKLKDEIKNLTLKEFQIFSLFIDACGQKISREEIHSKIWSGVHVQQKTVDVHLFNLRRKIEPFNLEIITTKTGEWILNKV